MKTISLYRSMFKMVDGESEFDIILSRLGIEANNVNEVELKVELGRMDY